MRLLILKWVISVKLSKNLWATGEKKKLQSKFKANYLLRGIYEVYHKGSDAECKNEHHLQRMGKNIYFYFKLKWYITVYTHAHWTRQQFFNL